MIEAERSREQLLMRRFFSQGRRHRSEVKNLPTSIDDVDGHQLRLDRSQVLVCVVGLILTGASAKPRS